MFLKILRKWYLVTVVMFPPAHAQFYPSGAQSYGANSRCQNQMTICAVVLKNALKTPIKIYANHSDHYSCERELALCEHERRLDELGKDYKCVKIKILDQ